MTTLNEKINSSLNAMNSDDDALEAVEVGVADLMVIEEDFDFIEAFEDYVANPEEVDTEDEAIIEETFNILHNEGYL